MSTGRHTAKVKRQCRTLAGAYCANWRDPSGRQRAKTFPTKKAARQFLAEIESSMTRGLYVDPHAGRTLFTEHATRWLDSPQHRRSRPQPAMYRSCGLMFSRSGGAGHSTRSTMQRCRCGGRYLASGDHLMSLPRVTSSLTPSSRRQYVTVCSHSTPARTCGCLLNANTTPTNGSSPERSW